MKYFLELYFLALNCIAFFAFYHDKKKSQKNKWRTPEARLIWIAFLGGGIGSLFGMMTFHHKTKKLKFKLLIPLAIVFNVLCYYYLKTWLMFQ